MLCPFVSAPPTTPADNVVIMVAVAFVVCVIEIEDGWPEATDVVILPAAFVATSTMLVAAVAFVTAAEIRPAADVVVVSMIEYNFSVVMLIKLIDVL